MADEYDETKRLVRDDADGEKQDVEEGDVDAFGDTAIASGDVADAFAPEALAPTDVAPGEVADAYDDTEVVGGDELDYGETQRVPGKHGHGFEPRDASGSFLPDDTQRSTGTFDFGDPDSEPADGLDEESFSETSVAPIKADDVEAAVVEDAIDDRFELQGLLGEGGMGKVYRGKQLSVDRDVAIKVVREEFAQDDELRERFFREAKLISGFNHPNIVRLIDFGESEGRLYLAMEFVNGRPISELFRDVKLHPRYALYVARQVAAALIEAHSKKVVHRDLKPENILLTRMADGTAQCKMLDFGVARTSTSDLTAQGTVCGTPDYMAPEQARGQEVTGAADIYAVGCMLFELLTGRLPFEADSQVAMMMKQVQEQPPRVRDIAPSVPEDVDEVVHSLLAKSVDDRISSASALCDTIDHVVSMHGWGGAVKLPNGPLAETTNEWHYDPSQDAAEGEEDTSGWLASGRHNSGEMSPKSPDTPRPAQRDGTPQPGRSRSPGSARSPRAERSSNVPAQPEMEEIELDYPDESPGQTQPQQQQRTTPATEHRQQQPQRTAQSTSMVGRSTGQSSGSNKALLAVIAVLLLLLVAAGVWIVIGQTTGSGEGDSAAEAAIASKASGEAARVLQEFAEKGWSVATPTLGDLGSIKVTSARISKGEATIYAAIYDCKTKSDVRIVFDGIVLPTIGYHYGDTVVKLEPDGEATEIEDIREAASIVEKLEPGGMMTNTSIK